LSEGDSAPKYRRVLLKLSGEAFKGPRDYGIDRETVNRIAAAVADVHGDGVQVAVVVGAGNILRGSTAEQEGMDRATADYMGMVATVLNSLALQDCLERIGVGTRVQSAIEMRQVAEPLIRRRAIRHLEKGRIVIFAGGTGNPFFTTDTTGALRANELSAEVMLKATNVDGVYDSDPRQNPLAIRLQEVDYDYALRHELRVMDAAAVAMCRDNNLPVIVFSLADPANIRRVIWGENIGTLVRRMPDVEGHR
jgi:uridylate kinase